MRIKYDFLLVKNVEKGSWKQLIFSLARKCSEEKEGQKKRRGSFDRQDEKGKDAGKLSELLPCFCFCVLSK